MIDLTLLPVLIPRLTIAGFRVHTIESVWRNQPEVKLTVDGHGLHLSIKCVAASQLRRQLPNVMESELKLHRALDKADGLLELREVAVPLEWAVAWQNPEQARLGSGYPRLAERLGVEVG